MKYRLIGDSCTDVTEKMREENRIHLVPLTINIDGETIVDDETFDQKAFLEKMKASPECPSSACPAPEAFMKLYSGEEDVYVVTLSSKLSGSYNSAMVARDMYLEENEAKNIAVIDSLSASIGQTLILLKVEELVKQGLSFEEVVKQAKEYRDHMATKFVLETLESLRKNGRLSGLKAIICNTLNIKPIMASDGHGSIIKANQARGMKRALETLAEDAKKEVTDVKGKVLGIAHCNNYERAVFVRDEILKRVPFEEVVIANTSGISSLYANDGGIVVCY